MLTKDVDKCQNPRDSTCVALNAHVLNRYTYKILVKFKLIFKLMFLFTLKLE